MAGVARQRQRRWRQRERPSPAAPTSGGPSVSPARRATRPRRPAVFHGHAGVPIDGGPRCEARETCRSARRACAWSSSGPWATGRGPLGGTAAGAPAAGTQRSCSLPDLSAEALSSHSGVGTSILRPRMTGQVRQPSWGSSTMASVFEATYRLPRSHPVSRSPRITGPAAVRALEQLGRNVQRQRGSHVVLRHPTLPGSIPVPMHANRILKQGTLANIRRAAGITGEEFARLL